MKKKSFLIIFSIIILAVITGTITGTDAQIFGITYHYFFDLLGSLFINALTLIIVPLILSSIISGISSIKDDINFKSLGIKTFSLFILINLLAIIIGLILINVFHHQLITSAKAIGTIKQGLFITKESSQYAGVTQIILKIIPSNIFKALSQGQMLGIIFFSIIFGFALTKIEEPYQKTLNSFFKGFFQCMMQITHFIMKLLPLGVFCLVAKEFSETGLNTIKPLSSFLVIMLFGLSIHFFIIIPIILKFVGKISPFSHMRNMQKALITAFSTSSSSASLPIILECLKKNSKIPTKIASLIVSLGCSINLSATALYVIITSSFISSVYGIELSLSVQISIFILSFLATLGIASIPSGSLITIILVLQGVGVPIEGIGIVVAIDRIIDMFRSMVNVFSISSCAVIISNTEKKLPKQQVLSSQQLN